jgi:tungstate transport system ATP-binding protein
VTTSILPCQAEDVSLSIEKRRLIKNTSLTLEQGPLSIILGPNGAGKSLLLRLLHGLIPPDEGRIIWGSGAHDSREGPHPRQAMVFQRPVMLRATASANIDYALRLAAVPRGERNTRCRLALERTGLAELGNQPARALSIGQQQRLALARAWALDPEVLFLDEPTANLDPAAARNVEAVITAMHEAGTKIVMTTHDLNQARRLADEILFLHRGRLVERRPAKDFFEATQSDEAKAFLAGDLVW